MPGTYADMSVEQLRLCAGEGDANAAFYLGKRLLNVRGGAMEGVEYLKQAARKRHLQACEMLGNTYLYGEGGVPQDKKQAMVYYEQAQALGSLTAGARLIDLYLASEDKAEKGLQLLEDAAKAGDGKSAARAARLYLSGEVGGVDPEKAAELALLSEDGAVLFEAAEKLEVLGGRESLCEKIYKKLLEAEEKGALSSLSSCIALSRLYRQGKGTKADGRRAEHLLLRAAELEKQQAVSSSRAVPELADLYAQGAPGLPADREKARSLLREAYKGGSESARARYIDLCTEDGKFEEGYRAWAEARRYGEAKNYLLSHWEEIPDRARFVERAFVYTALSAKENPALRELRDELFRRWNLAGVPADRVLSEAVKARDWTGAVTFLDGLNEAGLSEIYRNRTLCASLPDAQPGEPEALKKLREELSEVPEEIRTWENALAQWRGCATVQKKREYAKEMLPTLPPERDGEAGALTLLRRELSRVQAETLSEAERERKAEPEKEKPEADTPQKDGTETAECLRRWDVLKTPGHILTERVTFLMEALESLPVESVGEEAELTSFRREAERYLESAWKTLRQGILAERLSDAERVRRAQVTQSFLEKKADVFYETHSSAAYAALKNEIYRILREKDARSARDEAQETDREERTQYRRGQPSERASAEEKTHTVRKEASPEKPTARSGESSGRGLEQKGNPSRENLPEAETDIAAEWKRRLEIFNNLKLEEQKRTFARGSLGILPGKTPDEPVELSILRTLTAPYRADSVTLSVEERSAPAREEPKKAPQKAAVPEKETDRDSGKSRPEKKKRKGHAGLVFLLVVLCIGLLLGLKVLGVGGKEKTAGSTEQPEGTPLPENAVSLTSLTPEEAPQWFYTGHWDSRSHQGNFVILQEDGSTREADGFGMYVLTSSARETGEGEVSLRYALGGKYSTLTMRISPDQEWGCSAEAGTYEVVLRCDGEEVYDSGWLNYRQSDGISVDISGCETLEIVLRERPGSEGTLNIVFAEPELV